MPENNFKQEIMLTLKMMNPCPLCGELPSIRSQSKQFSASHGCVGGVLITTQQYPTWKRNKVAEDWNAWVDAVCGV